MHQFHISFQNKYTKMSSFKSSEYIQKKKDGSISYSEIIPFTFGLDNIHACALISFTKLEARLFAIVVSQITSIASFHSNCIVSHFKMTVQLYTPVWHPKHNVNLHILICSSVWRPS